MAVIEGQALAGMASRVCVQAGDFDIGAELALIRAHSPQTGAIATFVGLVRDVNEHRQVGSMYLEHYPGMTERAIRNIIDDARGRWGLHDVTVIHRVGKLKPTDQIVFVAVGSGHRGEAFAGCEFIMDYLKTRAPFWKREATNEGDTTWVGSRTSDQVAAERW